MSTATLPPVTPVTRSVPPAVRRPARPRSGVRPVARPALLVPGPDRPVSHRADVRSCRVETGIAVSGWRLTDRGIALVLVLALMIIVAAATVVGLTAWQVTGADYYGAGSTGFVTAR